MARVKDPVSFIKYAENYLAELKRKGKMGTHDKTNATLLKYKFRGLYYFQIKVEWFLGSIVTDKWIIINFQLEHSCPICFFK